MLETPGHGRGLPRPPGRRPASTGSRSRSAAQVSTVTYPYNPLDAVGWHGDLAPVRLNVADLRPVASHRYHLPPSVHTTFSRDRFVVCTFAPRPFETDPGALKVPFFHNNDDFDEVLFYHAGDFFSRDHIEAGMMTFHPVGLHPRPAPQGAEEHAEPAQARHRRIRRDDRHPRPAGGGRGRRLGGEPGLRRQLEEPHEPSRPTSSRRGRRGAGARLHPRLDASSPTLTPWGDTFEGFTPGRPRGLFRAQLLWEAEPAATSASRSPSTSPAPTKRASG